jgi:PAS domain S-box-containing protein
MVECASLNALPSIPLVTVNFMLPTPCTSLKTLLAEVAPLDDQLWKTVINTMQEGLMLVAPDGEIVFVNRSFEKLLGYGSAEVIGKSCQLFQCDQCSRLRADGLGSYCTLFNQEGEIAKECVFQRKDGHPVHLLKNAAVIKDRAGKVIGGVETLTDLTSVVAKEKVIETLRRQLHYDDGFQGIIGKSPLMRQVYDLTASAAQSDAPLIIYGESGTGKELLAAAIHQLSPRAGAPFVKVNCAALNNNLLESELFGHVKGAFTGAEHKRIGRFEAAHGGSIFLDEIGDLPLLTQTKLLRVLQEMEIERVGDNRPIKIDVRVIAATHKDLHQLIGAGLFREDLYYRISVIPVTLPPLRERRQDIPLLLETFMKQMARKSGKKLTGITREAMDLLINHGWPGNVRELINVLEYAYVVCRQGEIGPVHLPGQFQEGPAHRKAGLAQTGAGAGEQFRRERLLTALEESGGNQSRAAEILGVSRVTVWKWRKRYRL